MLHLSPERLAALVDEAPSAGELVHLTSCAECARERRTYQRLGQLASSEAGRIGIPLTSWESLAPALTADRVIDRGGEVLSSRRRSRALRGWLQAAAAVLLVGGGMIGGRLTAGAGALPVAQAPAMTTPVASMDTSMAFQTVEQALAAQERSQAVYQNAMSFLAQHDTASRSTDTPSAMRTRLAALDRVRETMGEALDKAPYDPVINDYLFSVIGQREATLRQLNTALPAGMRLVSY